MMDWLRRALRDFYWRLPWNKRKLERVHWQGTMRFTDVKRDGL